MIGLHITELHMYLRVCIQSYQTLKTEQHVRKMFDEYRHLTLPDLEGAEIAPHLPSFV